VTDPKNHPKNPTNTDTTYERPPVDYSAITDEALRKKLTDPKTLARAAELAPYGVDLLAALAAPPPDNLTIGINEGPPFDWSELSHIRTASISTIFGCKPGETMFEAIARKKKEEAERASAFVEDALNEQAAAESGDDQAQAFITEGATLLDAIERKKSEEN